MALGTAAFALVSAYAGGHWILGLIAAFATGAVCGLINGLLVAKLNIPSLVITIGTSFLFRGLELVLMNGTGVPLTADQFPAMHRLLREPVFGFPVQTLWMILLTFLFWLLLNRSRFGAHVFLVGDNPTSARLMGGQRGVGEGARLRPRRPDGGLRRPDDLLLTATTSGRRPATASCSTPSPRSSSAAPRSSAAPARWSAPSSPPSSSARSTPASSRPGINAFYTQLAFGLVIVISVVLQTVIERRIRRQSLTGR